MHDLLPSPPRYRVEHCHPGLAPIIVGFADTRIAADARLTLVRQRLRLAGADGELVLIDQMTERVCAVASVPDGPISGPPRRSRRA